MAELVLVRSMTRLLFFFLGAAVVTSSWGQTSDRRPLPEWMRDPQSLVFYAPKPEYPVTARALRMVGSGVYFLRLRADGTVESVRVTQSTGHPELDQSCVEAFRCWRFRPKFVQFSRRVKIPVTFTMAGAHY